MGIQMAKTWNIVNREPLLSSLANALLHLSRCPAQGGPKREPKLSELYVTFYSQDDSILGVFEAVKALHYLVEDIYWDEENNWSLTTRLVVTTY
jgi:hypothetical protein